MRREQRRVVTQITLFILTLISTTLAGAEWTYSRSIFMEDYSWADFVSGFEFSLTFLGILTVHELGHYFTARFHGVNATLPYYIPVPPFPLSIGTMGAVIRLRSKVYSKKQNFDIGISGPLAGFVMTIIIMFYGFTHLPEPEYIFQIHPDYQQYGLEYADHVYDNLPVGIPDITFGKNLLFIFFEKVVADPARVPNPHELMHYPMLFASFLSLIFMCLNLLPIGQLDGGHVVYGLFGFKSHRIIATTFFMAFLLYASLGAIDLKMEDKGDLALFISGAGLFLYFSMYGLGLSKINTLMYALLILAALLLMAQAYPELQGYSGWLAFVFIVGRFIGIKHPPSEIEEPLDGRRVILGWIALLIFVISFSPMPIMLK
jgi:membrane-associated protease RseP (regulator of RpoE activity)